MRIIFSLEIEIEPADGNHSAHLIAPLNRAGQSPFTGAAPPKTRVIDLRVGDYLLHRGERRKVLGIKAHRDCEWTSDSEPPADVYIVGRPGAG